MGESQNDFSTGAAGARENFLAGSGETGALIAAFDWRATSLGPIETWPQSLKTATSILLRSSVPIVMLWGEDGVMIYNDAYSVFAGGRHPQLLGSKVREGWAEISDFNDNVMKVGLAGKTLAYRNQELTLHRQGVPEQVWMNLDYSPVLDESGKPAGVIAIVVETTQEVLTQRALRQSEERLQLALSAGRGVGTWDWDVRTDRVTADERFAKLYRVDPEKAAAGAPIAEFFRAVHPDDLPALREAIGTALRTGDSFWAEYRLLQPDGSVRWAAAEGRCTLGADGTPLRFPGVTFDITERKETEQQLRDSEGRFQGIVNSIDQMIWSTRPDGYHDYYNDRWYEYTGMPHGSTDGEAWNGMFHPADQERAWAVWRQSLESGKPYHIEYRLRHHSGQYRWVLGRAQPVRDESGRITRWFGTCTDIQDSVEAREVLARSREELEGLIAERTAELARTHEALRQSQKMEVVGQLTGGVAHDFNNLLQIVTGNLDILQRHLPADAVRLRRSANNAMTGAKRAAALTQRLLAFSRRQPLEPKPISVNRLVGGMSELLSRTLGETIEIETVLSGSLWQVEADPNQLESAILNLAVNARDAMPDGGMLTIETANTHLDRAYAAQNAEVPPGQYVVICVTDTGTGMDKATIAKAFEPFFTTKEVGKGTGLGLSQVYGFVKQSGGNVKIYSEPGEGTTVKIYLPRLVSEAAEEKDEVEALVPEGSRLETILVVEDDDDVRAYSVEVLRELGYRVLEAHDGPSAIRLLERQEGEVDLLFSDVVLPGGMTGAGVAEEARRLLPGLKVLFTTGYARNAIVHQGRLDPGVNLITKPFTYADLAARVRDILDGQG